MRFIKSSVLANILLAGGITHAHVAHANTDIHVVTSIKPIHSLASAVMGNVATPYLLIEGTGSPHGYNLKPSQAKELQNADIIFWVGHELETSLAKPISTIAKKATSVELIDSHNLIKLKFREGETFENHDHDRDDHGKKEDHHKHDEHKHGEHKQNAHKHDEHKQNAHKHGEHKHSKPTHKTKHNHDHHGHDGIDGHIWLDPQNAIAMVHEMVETLSAKDPKNAKTYEKNAENVIAQLNALTLEIKAITNPIKDKKFVVFHDAYHYFEARFGMNATGTITLSPEVPAGAERIKTLQNKIKTMNAVCVFSEPQFPPKLVSTVIENTTAKTGVLDPIGASIPKGKDHYFTLIRNMANAMKTCFEKAT